MTDSAVNKMIKLEGTNWDRRRKLSVEDVEYIRDSYSKGNSIRQLANFFNVDVNTIRYHVDNEFKNHINKCRNSYAHSPAITTHQNRVDYKRTIAESMTR